MQKLIRQFSNLSSFSTTLVTSSLGSLGRQIITKATLRIPSKEIRIRLARELMQCLTPIPIRLEKGAIKKLDENTIVEKTKDGKIIIYEVVP